MVTGSVSINSGFIVLSKRQARILWTAIMVLGLVIVSRDISLETRRFGEEEMALSGFFVFFVAMVMLTSIMTAVQLVRWTRAGEGGSEVRRRALFSGFVFVFQLAILIGVVVVFATL